MVVDDHEWQDEITLAPLCLHLLLDPRHHGCSDSMLQGHLLSSSPTLELVPTTSSVWPNVCDLGSEKYECGAANDLLTKMVCFDICKPSKLAGMTM